VLAAVGVGVPVGPLLVLRLDRMGEFGLVPILLTAAVLVLWGIAGTLLAAGWWRRPGRAVERTALPGADPELDASPGPEPSPGVPDPPAGASHPPRAG
jgi:hypothetical protein